jgi:hypothetical protein
MQRKLLRSMTALSATATVFTLLLLAAGPVQAPTTLPRVALASVDATAAPAIDAVADQVAVRQRHHLHRARSQLALPYFSFAQGLRHGRS